MSYADYIRYKALKEAYDKLSDEEKKALVRQSVEEQRHREIMAMLNEQHSQISHIANKVEKQSWWTDFGSDIAANFTTDAIIYLGAKLLKKL